MASRRYPFQVAYSTRDYLDLLATQSGTRALGEARSADFLARVRDWLQSLGSPPLTATFVGFLTIGRRTPRPAAAPYSLISRHDGMAQTCWQTSADNPARPCH